MSNSNKAIIFGALFLTTGLFIKLGAAAIPSSEKRETGMADINTAISASDSALEDIMEIPGKKEPKTPNNLDIQAGMVIDLSSGEEILSVNKFKRWPIASVSKMMSSVVAIENLDPDREIIFSAEAIATEGVAGGFKEGEAYSVSDLIASMMVVSSNDASVALMESLPNGSFISMMNAKAKEMGMIDTYFAEPTGLSILNQSTASDLGILISHVWRNYPELFDISSGKDVFIKELNSGTRKRLTNINSLSSRRDYLGGKTGYTEDASENILAVFSLNKKPLAFIVLGAENRILETEKIINFIKNDINSSN
jgi:D-alanyl-D-alanine carboxypeptidase